MHVLYNISPMTGFELGSSEPTEPQSLPNWLNFYDAIVAVVVVQRTSDYIRVRIHSLTTFIERNFTVILL